MDFQTISHYRIIKKLGAGGMGEVYLGEDRQVGRRVAIKLLPTETISDEHARKRLVREARAAALAGDIAKSRKAYQDFLALWKDADPDIPVLQEAKREYEKLGQESCHELADTRICH